MTGDGQAIEIRGTDYWFKVVGFLQQNWALVDVGAGGATIWFLGDTSGVFDQIQVRDQEEAAAALVRNGFRKYSDDPQARGMFGAPAPPFRRAEHPHGPIYSSGQFWK